MSISVERCSGELGAVVRDLDVRDLDDATFAEVLQAWSEHLVLFFPGQHLSPTEQRDFAARFGPLEQHPLTEKFDDTPEITVLHSDRGGRADVWHTDVTFSEHPPIAAVLQQISGPEVGGDTMWTNQYLAFERLSAPLRSLLEGLTAVHSAWPQGRPDLTAERPVVITHPVTGRKALAVNRQFTIRIPQLEKGASDALLGHLFDAGDQPDLSVRWRWTPGDVVIWDNRCTRHYAIGDYECERVMHRVTVLGDYAEPYAPSPWPAHDTGRLSAQSSFSLFR